MVRKAQRIQQGENLNKRKCWALQTDGDLWAVLEKLVRSKGERSVLMSWCKGHANDTHIQQGITTLKDKLGNDASDQIATKGGQGLHTQQVQELAHLQHIRAKAYARVLNAIHDVICNVVKADKEKRDAATKGIKATLQQGQHYNRIAAQPLAYCHRFDHITNFIITDFPPFWPTYSNHAHYYPQIWAFLKDLRGVEASAHRPGVTWIELAALFTLRGGNHTDENREDAINPATPHIKPILKAFQRVTKRVLADTADNVIARMLTPAKYCLPRLQCIGITNHQPAVNFVPEVKEQEAHQITLFLLHCKHRLTNKNLDAIAAGHFTTPKIKVHFKGKATWKGLNATTEAIPQRLNHSNQHTTGDPTGAAAQAAVVAANRCDADPIGQEVGMDTNSRDSMILGAAGNAQQCQTVKTTTHLHCPMCGNAKNLVQRNICHPTKWAMLTCSSCRQRHTANKWHCPCHIRWHACRHHAAKYNHLRHTTPNVSTKRRTHTAHTTMHILPPLPTKRRKAIDYEKIDNVKKRVRDKEAANLQGPGCQDTRPSPRTNSSKVQQRRRRYRCSAGKRQEKTALN